MVEVCPQAAFGIIRAGEAEFPASHCWHGGGSAEMYWKEKYFLP